MAYSAKVGSFNIDTTKTAGQTQAIEGVGFQPKIVLFWWSRSTATGDSVASGSINIGFGAAISSSSRFCNINGSDDAAGTTNSYGRLSNTDCIRILTAVSTYDGIMDFSSMDADGFTLVVDEQFSEAARISYLALGGDDLTNVYIGGKQTPTVTGNYTVTGASFQPDAVILSGAGVSTVTDFNSFYSGFGMATGASNQGVVMGYTQDNQGTSNTFGYGYNGEAMCVYSSQREAFVQFDADGFTMNHLEGGSATYFFYIALKGGQYSVGDLTTRTDGNDIAETVGFQPVALLFASANRALSTQDAVTDHNRLSIGAGTSTSNRAVQAISDEDNLADSETAYANYDTAVYAHVVDDAIVGLMDIKSIDASGFTAVMDDTDPSACWVAYLAIGATGGAVPSESVSPSVSPSASLSPSASESPSVSGSASVSPSISGSASVSPSISGSPSVSESPSVSPSISASASVSPSISGSPSASPSISGSASVSPSVSPSASVSTSVSGSASESPSVSGSPSESLSISGSASESPTVSASASVSPSISGSASESLSVSPSPSVSPSISGSASFSPSISGSPSVSLSVSESPSVSLSISPSASASPSTPTGDVCWGHVTGVLEDNIRTFSGNWTGTGEISGVGDAEVLCLDEGETMTSEVVDTGAVLVTLLQNVYAVGDTVVLSYRHGATEGDCLAAAWNDYTDPFVSLGYVQVMVEYS